MKLKFFLQLFGGLSILVTVLPFIAIDYWWIRVFDFPHLQLTAFTLLIALLFLFRFDSKKWMDYAFFLVLVGCLVFQCTKIYPYTPLANFEVLNSTPNSDAPTLSIYAANVLQTNEQKDKLIATIEAAKTDLLLFTETDYAWKKQIAAAISKDYPYYIGIPLSNTYGMLLYSKLPLIDPQVQFIVDDSIPSIHSLFLLPSGDTIQLFAIHPTPPMPQHNPSSTDRDAEMMKIALKSLNTPYPVVVVGDFNDVAWSESNENFQEVSRLLDPRKGRGFYNTFHADYFFLRWPLDHVFVSKHFRVSAIKREADINSDHFPISIHLTFEPQKASVQKAPAPKKEDIEKANKQIEAEVEVEKEEAEERIEEQKQKKEAEQDK